MKWLICFNYLSLSSCHVSFRETSVALSILFSSESSVPGVECGAQRMLTKYQSNEGVLCCLSVAPFKCSVYKGRGDSWCYHCFRWGSRILALQRRPHWLSLFTVVTVAVCRSGRRGTLLTHIEPLKTSLLTSSLFLIHASHTFPQWSSQEHIEP